MRNFRHRFARQDFSSGISYGKSLNGIIYIVIYYNDNCLLGHANTSQTVTCIRTTAYTNINNKQSNHDICAVIVFCAMSSVAISRGILLDCASKDEATAYEGGYVMEPVRGHHHDVAVLDDKSLGPSVMREMSIFIDCT